MLQERGDMLWALQAEAVRASDPQRGAAAPSHGEAAVPGPVCDGANIIIELSSGDEIDSARGSPPAQSAGGGQVDAAPAAERRDGKRPRVESPPPGLEREGGSASCGAATNAGGSAEEAEPPPAAAHEKCGNVTESDEDDDDATRPPPSRDWEDKLVTAKFDYTQQADDEMSFAAGDKFSVLGHGLYVGWLHVEAHSAPVSGRKGKAPAVECAGKSGLVPTNHLEPCTAAWGWEAQHNDELSFQEGDLLVVLGRSGDEGWLYADLLARDDEPTRRGLVPSHYLVSAGAQHGADPGECADAHDAGASSSCATHGPKKGAAGSSVKRPKPWPVSGGGRPKAGKRAACGGASGAAGPSAGAAGTAGPSAAAAASAASAAPAASGQKSDRTSAARADNLALSCSVCVLCQGVNKAKSGGGGGGGSGDGAGNPCGRLIGPLQMGSKEVSVHSMCYHFCPKAQEDQDIAPPEAAENINLELLQAQVRQASRQVCEICKGPGAAIACMSCLSQRAPKYYHLQCADNAQLVEWHTFSKVSVLVHLPNRDAVYRLLRILVCIGGMTIDARGFSVD